VLIPVYNEEKSVAPLAKSIKTEMDKIDEPYETIFMNDGSTDETLPRLKKLRESDPHLAILTLEKNSGQTASLNMGFQMSKGEVIISMDGDLQNDPSDIVALLKKLDEGYDVVCGWRKKRHDSLWKKLSSKVANIAQSLIFKSHLHDIACTLRVYRKSALAGTDLSWNGAHRFIPYLLMKHGKKVGEMEVRHHPRIYGKSKYKPTKIFKTVKDFFVLLITRKI